MMTDARVEMDEVTLRSIDLKKETDRLTTRSLPPPPNLPTTTLFLFSTLDGHAHFRFFFITYHYYYYSIFRNVKEKLLFLFSHTLFDSIFNRLPTIIIIATFPDLKNFIFHHVTILMMIIMMMMIR